MAESICKCLSCSKGGNHENTTRIEPYAACSWSSSACLLLLCCHDPHALLPRRPRHSGSGSKAASQGLGAVESFVRLLGNSQAGRRRECSCISAIMPSPRSSPKSSHERRAHGNKLEFISLTSMRNPGPPESPSRRREGTASTGPPQALPEEDCMKLNPSFVDIALRSLLAIDLWASKKLGVCAGESSSWGSVRPLMIVVEISGHGIPWLAGTLYGLCRSGSSAGREVLLNLLFALVLDLILVAAAKGLVKRRRPAHNKMDMFATISVDKYSFPSGHATRAALVCRFILHHLVLALPLRVLVVLWVFIVGISRVMLGRHNVTDVIFGLLMGYMQYSMVEYFWLSPVTAPILFMLWS
ncbi:polyisoprenoid diphosphate/phosphate phosphohydrolase PLPP6 isoform X1 [Anolis carolinensis]